MPRDPKKPNERAPNPSGPQIHVHLLPIVLEELDSIRTEMTAEQGGNVSQSDVIRRLIRAETLRRNPARKKPKPATATPEPQEPESARSYRFDSKTLRQINVIREALYHLTGERPTATDLLRRLIAQEAARFGGA